MFVCMFDIYVVIKENHLDLHWTLSHMFIHSKNLVYLWEGVCNKPIPSHWCLPNIVNWTESHKSSSIYRENQLSSYQHSSQVSPPGTSQQPCPAAKAAFQGPVNNPNQQSSQPSRDQPAALPSSPASPPGTSQQPCPAAKPAFQGPASSPAQQPYQPSRDQPAALCPAAQPALQGPAQHPSHPGVALYTA